MNWKYLNFFKNYPVIISDIQNLKHSHRFLIMTVQLCKKNYMHVELYLNEFSSIFYKLLGTFTQYCGGGRF